MGAVFLEAFLYRICVHLNFHVTSSRKVASGLIELGLQKQDKVCISGPTKGKWVIADMAAQLAGTFISVNSFLQDVLVSVYILVKQWNT